LLAYDSGTFVAEHPIEDPLEEFLALKHLFAIQATLEVLTGREPGGPDDACAAAEISYDGSDMIIDARISVELVTEKIKSCGNCKLCGKNKKEKAKIVFS